MDELQEVQSKTEQSLRQLPDPPGVDAFSDLMDLFADFENEIKMLVEGEPGQDGLIQQLRKVQEEFRRQIRSSAPDFRPVITSQDDGPVTMDFLEDEDGETVDQGDVIYIKEVKTRIEE